MTLINGRYAATGEGYHGRPCYKSPESGLFLYHTNDYGWTVGYEVGSTDYYAHNTQDVSSPELLTQAWTVKSDGGSEAEDPLVRATCRGMCGRYIPCSLRGSGCTRNCFFSS